MWHGKGALPATPSEPDTGGRPRDLGGAQLVLDGRRGRGRPRRPGRASEASAQRMDRPAVRPNRRRTFLSGLTVVFVAAVTLVTTVPINVLITPAELAEAYAPSVIIRSASPQELATVSGGADVPISRDQYTVTSLKKKLLAVTAGRRASYFNDPSWSIQWPIGVGVPMSDQFGPRVLCDSCGVTQHRGADFLPGDGAPVQAIADGVVRYVEESDQGLGVHVIIDHRIDGELVSSVYCHMQFGSVPVYPGQEVEVGQLVGAVGNTGFSFGPHLHFEIRLNGSQNTDPVAWLEQHVG